MEALNITPTGITPASLGAATAARPIEATHPHEAQSGVPPNWHGVISVFRSADTIFVVRAKTQSCGLAGGAENCRIKPSAMSSFGYLFRNSAISITARLRSSVVSISGKRSPICGVNRLNHTFLISDLGVQTAINSLTYSGLLLI